MRGRVAPRGPEGKELGKPTRSGTAYALRLTVGDSITYKPWALSDMTLLKANLPELTNGGGPFLSGLQGLTSGVQLALGDVRAIVGSAVGSVPLAAVK